MNLDRIRRIQQPVRNVDSEITSWRFNVETLGCFTDTNEDWEILPGSPGRREGHSGRRHDMKVFYHVLQLAHLGVRLPEMDVREAGTRLVRACVDYFVGDWRDSTFAYSDHCNRAQCRQELPWVDEMRLAIMAAALCADLQALQNMLSFAGPDLPPDSAAGWSVKERQAFGALADMICLSPTNKPLAQVKKKPAPTGRASALVFGADRVLMQDAAGAQAAAINLVKNFIKREYNPQYSRIVVSWEASFVAAFAKMHGLEVELEESLNDYVLPPIDELMTQLERHA